MLSSRFFSLTFLLSFTTIFFSYTEPQLVHTNEAIKTFCILQESQPEAEAALSPRQCRRKTTQDAHGSFFLRVGAIGEFADKT